MVELKILFWTPFLRKGARKGKKVRHFSMHVLRHTFATRCIEGGMKPKILQKISGHSNISITMNLFPKKMVLEMVPGKISKSGNPRNTRVLKEEKNK